MGRECEDCRVATPILYSMFVNRFEHKGPRLEARPRSMAAIWEPGAVSLEPGAFRGSASRIFIKIIAVGDTAFRSKLPAHSSELLSAAVSDLIFH